MIFLVISFAVPTAIFTFLPMAMKWLFGKEPPRDTLLFSACALYAISWYLPSPLVDGANTQFTTHFLGGGVFCGLIWLYVKRNLHWNAPWWLEATSLYATVCTLGVTNELFEFALWRLNITGLSGGDTWWDLVANTLGAFTFWIIYTISHRTKRTKRT